jgi:hypothetical protein
MTNSRQTANAIVAHAVGVRLTDPAFFTERKPEPVKAITPILSDIERRAMQAAWRIDREPLPESLNKLACASTRHARYIEYVAKIISEEFGG